MAEFMYVIMHSNGDSLIQWIKCLNSYTISAHTTLHHVLQQDTFLLYILKSSGQLKLYQL